jgi:membrane protein implicated in regulation of membrane protease activity
LIGTWHDVAVTSARDKTNGDGLPRVPSIPLTDEAAFDPAGNESIGHLVKDATAHLSTLVRAEIELAKGEIAQSAKRAVIGSIFFIVALVILLYSSFFFFFFAAELVDSWLHRRWLSYLIVFGAMLVIAVLAAFLGWRRVKKIRPPQRTISSLKDTTAALTHRGNGEAGTELSVEVTPGTPSRA